MKIIILGAGQVGGTLAEKLASEENDITVVDSNAERLRELQDRLDIRTITGMASFPSILKQAGADDADMLIAVTSADEVNMVACQIAYTMFTTPLKIARIRQTAYQNIPELFDKEAIPIDVIISPEEVVTQYVTQLIEHPGALQVLDFAGGKVQLVAVKAYEGSPLVNQKLRIIRDHMPDVDARVAAIFRKGKAIMPKGTTVIEAGDEVFFIADRKHIRKVMNEFQRLDQHYKRIIIVGGGNIGLRLAKRIENKYNVKIIDNNAQCCRHLSRSLNKAIVFNGDASDRDLLLAESIEETDVFIALTNNNETNLMSSLLAKQLGVRKAMTLINNPLYIDLFQGDAIDVMISPQLATISSLLRHVRRGDVVNVYSLRRGVVEAIEVIAHGDKTNSKVIGRTIGAIELPLGTSIEAVVRSDQVLIAHDHIELQSDDHIILLLTDRKRVNDVEKLFQVGITFFR
ncbi:MAG: Trk system potassium transporter TrkA [Endozoicomonadaceae bacterium]|nr:Trk system potassium transporter TrkA [Endozoicomonadaceae bacterium]